MPKSALVYTATRRYHINIRYIESGEFIRFKERECAAPQSREYIADGINQWRHDITRYFQHGAGETIPIMMLGLKRDLRTEGEGVIYPQEVSTMFRFDLVGLGISSGLTSEANELCSRIV